VVRRVRGTAIGRFRDGSRVVPARRRRNEGRRVVDEITERPSRCLRRGVFRRALETRHDVERIVPSAVGGVKALIPGFC